MVASFTSEQECTSFSLDSQACLVISGILVDQMGKEAGPGGVEALNAHGQVGKRYPIATRTRGRHVWGGFYSGVWRFP